MARAPKSAATPPTVRKRGRPAKTSTAPATRSVSGRDQIRLTTPHGTATIGPRGAFTFEPPSGGAA